MRSLDSRDDAGNSYVSSYTRILEKNGFAGQSALRLARAAMAHIKASGVEPESEAGLYAFSSGLAHSLYCVIYRDDEDRAFLEGLDRLIGDGAIPTWANAFLRELDWRCLYDQLLPGSRFRTRADKLDLKPVVQDRIRDWRTLSFASLPEDLKTAILDDDKCRQVWLERLAAERSEMRAIYYDEFLKGAAEVQKLDRIFDHLPAEFALSEDIRAIVLSDQRRVIDAALDAQQGFTHAFGRAATPCIRTLIRELHFRRADDPNASWGRLDALGQLDFIELLKHWSFVVARTYSDVEAPPAYRPMEPTVVAKLYYPILGDLVRRGSDAASKLAREILTDEAVTNSGSEDWRAPLIDFQNVVTRTTVRRFVPGWQQPDGQKLPFVPDLAEWFKHKSQLDELMAKGLTTTLAADAEMAARVAYWLDVVNSERGSIRDTGVCIVKWALAGLARTGQWSKIESLIERLSGKFQPHIDLRATLNEAVAEAAMTGEREHCEEFVLRVLARADFKPSHFPIELAVSFALQSRSEVDEVLSSPDTAELSFLGEGWHPRSMEPARLVALARRLTHSPRILDALTKQYCALPKEAEIRIQPAGIGVHGVELGEMLYATGDARLNPPVSVTWPRTWLHLLEWHLSAGDGIEEYFSDIWNPRHGRDDNARFLPMQIEPMRILACQQDLIDKTPDSEAAAAIKAQLLRLNGILNVARMSESLPRFHVGWRAYAELGPWPDEGGEFINLDLNLLPKRRIPLLETSYRRAQELAGSQSAGEIGWPLFAELAVLLAEHSAYPELVTLETQAALVERSKQALMAVRQEAAHISIGAPPPGPGLSASLAVLCAFKDYASALRQLLLIYREIPVPALPPSLDAREATESTTGWSAIPDAVSRLLANSPRDQRDELRFALADYLQDRVKPRKPAAPAAATARPEEDANMIEVNRFLREAYVEALADLRTDRGGRLHRLLGNVALEDPSPEVKDAAKRCAVRARQYGKEPPRGSVGRMLMNAWWWIRLGTNRRLGADMVDSGSARVTRVREVTQLRGESEVT